MRSIGVQGAGHGAWSDATTVSTPGVRQQPKAAEDKLLELESSPSGAVTLNAEAGPDNLAQPGGKAVLRHRNAVLIAPVPASQAVAQAACSPVGESLVALHEHGVTPQLTPAACLDTGLCLHRAGQRTRRESQHCTCCAA